jgi:hypothetical protein
MGRACSMNGREREREREEELRIGFWWECQGERDH